MNMSTIQVLDKTFEPYLNEAAIQEKITELALQLNKDYAGKRPLFLSVLNGSFLFTADLFKQITIEAEVSFIKLASYKGTSSTGNVITAIGLDINVKDRYIIILEDIIDTGKTLHHYLPQLESMQPASVKIAVLLDKKEALQYPVKVDYACFEIPNKFVVGYGLDYDGLGRNSKDIYQLQA
jgi:hypoxanthine phosphoribosyltransferase